MNKMNKVGSKSGLAIVLSKLKGFENAKVRVEQYITDSEVAATILWDAMLKGDIAGKTMLDLGCGSGILGIGALILGASECYFVDSDEDAMDICKENMENIKSDGLVGNLGKFLCCDISKFNDKVDTVLQNPPFGTKVRHADRAFLEKALSVGNIIYSLHKTSTQKFVLEFASVNDFDVTHVLNFDFPLKASYAFHRRKMHRIEVSCFRMKKKG